MKSAYHHEFPAATQVIALPSTLLYFVTAPPALLRDRVYVPQVAELTLSIAASEATGSCERDTLRETWARPQPISGAETQAMHQL